uniref:SfiI-subtelomeric related protein family member, putative n=1 Tax=Theileria annulata TaxID=5874 RepID=A0A3B0NCX9_THEAN
MFPQVVQAPYPKYLAILRNGKPYVIRKNSLSEPWYNITHLRYDIEKLLFTDSNNKEYNYTECSVELYELILVIEFGFNCKKVWFDGKLCWALTNSQEYPKFLGLHLRTNQIFLMFSKLRLELLDVENPKVEEGEIEGNMSGKRPAQLDWVRNIKYKKMSNSTNPFRPMIDPTKLVDTNPFSKSVRRRLIREAELKSVEEPSQSCPKQHQTTLENDEADKVTKIDVIGKSYKNIVKLFQENAGNVIECNGYNLTVHGDNYSYKLNESASSDNLNSTSTSFRKENPKKLPPKSIVYYKKEKNVVLETRTKFIMYNLEDPDLTPINYKLPEIKLLSQDNEGNIIPLSSNEYSVQLSLYMAVKFIYTFADEAVCTQVEYGRRIFWKSKPGQNKPLYIVCSYWTRRIQIIFQDKIVLTDLKNPNSIPSSLKIPPEISLYKTNEQGKTVRLNCRDYRVELNPRKKLRYVVNEEVNCTELRHKGRVVWKYKEGPIPLSFVYSSILKTISVAYKTGTRSYQLELGQWVPTETTNTN